MNSVTEDILMHYGMPRRSGRYPWGSGKDPFQRTGDFLSRIEELQKDGWTETKENIKATFNMSTTQYRNEKKLAQHERKMHQMATAKRMMEKEGLSRSEVARQLGVNESTIRSWFNPKTQERLHQAQNTADFLKSQINEKGMIEVGKGTELELGITETRLAESLLILEKDGYPVYRGRVPQATNPGQMTTITVACPPGTAHKEIYNYDQIHSVKEYKAINDGESFKKKFTYPTSMDSSRLMIRGAEDGGTARDGVIELRRGVEDLSLGESRYSQVRILVDDKYYLKGMAVYSDDMPPGVDVIFNSNKSKEKGLDTHLKKIKDDPENPFGSAIKDADQGGQYWYKDKDGNEKLGLINKRSDEGDWTEWADALPSQFLSKQSHKMAEKQLGLAIADKQAEYDSICELTNPTIKKNLLEDFASNCDSAAVHLKAAALPGQKYHVILPINTLKDNEVYAPQYEPGTKLALIRYPHGGTFEIPILTVNNRNVDGKKFIGSTSIDAVGINKKVADRLSGADFDGDTVMCIPTHDRAGKVKITSTKALDGLEGFDSKSYQYTKMEKDEDGNEHYYENGIEFRRMSKQDTQKQMGMISNLICDMTLKGANEDELARAVRHSMVVIDAHKHCLNYRRSEIDNNIAALKDEYQGGGGASTLISRAKREYTVDKRQGTPKTNTKGKEWYDPTKPEGALLYKTTDDLTYQTAKVYKRSTEDPNATVHLNKKGTPYIQVDGEKDWIKLEGKAQYEEGTRVHAVIKTNNRKQKSTEMAETDDAYTLVSDADTPMERLYADYANTMKRMANEARLEIANTGKIAYSPTAAKTYAKEVRDLEEKLNTALLNAPREKRANLLAAAEVKAKQESNPGMTKEEIKKARQQAITKYRNEVGSVARRDREIQITDREWEAIQAGAIHESKLKNILNNSDKDALRQRAMPRETSTLSQAQINRIKALADSNYTLEQIAKKIGKSPSVVSKCLKGD